MDQESLDILNRLFVIIEQTKIILNTNDLEKYDGAVNNVEEVIETLNIIANFDEKSRLLYILDNLKSTLLNISDHSNLLESKQIFISKNSLEYLLSKGFKTTSMSKMLNISTRTLYRRMAEFGLSVRGTYTQLSDSELISIVQTIMAAQPNTGIKRMRGHLFSRNIRVTEFRLRKIMRLADPIGVYNRTLERNSVIRRRQYYVKYSNQIWHIDANLKLNRWGFVIRGAVDGKSRAAIYLKASSDNRADSHLETFKEAVRIFGMPLRTRTDKGKENVLIAEYMIMNRGAGVSAHLCGRSVHNQRIERFWRDVTYGCTSVFYNVFYALEDDGWLKIDDPKHIYLLHKIFIPKLNLALDEFKNGWNSHPLSTERNMTPLQLWTINLYPPAYDLQTENEETEEASYFPCNQMSDLDNFDEENEITSPPALVNLLDENEQSKLDQFDFNRQSLSFGYNIFKEAVCLLNSA